MLILALLTALVSIVCWIIVLVKMFSDSVGKGVLGLICGLYAFIWGWQNKDQVGSGVMIGWTIAIIASIGVRVLLAGSQ